MEVKCRICGGETIQEDGICRPCALFRKDEVAALSEIRRGGIEKAAEKTKTLRQTKAAPCLTAGREEKTGGVEMRKNKVCSKCNTGALSNRAKECHKCGEPFTKKAAAVNEKKKRGRPSKAVIPAKVGMTKNKGNWAYPNIMFKLMNAKSDKQQELTEIENAIKVLKKYD